VVCVECLPADKPWDVVSVCDTPELWCGAAGLYARVRACAGSAAESLHTYIHNMSFFFLILDAWLFRVAGG